MTNRELRTIKRQRKIRNELILLGVYDFAGLVCLVGAMVGTVYVISGVDVMGVEIKSKDDALTMGLFLAVTAKHESQRKEIGRASCRERV